MKKNIFKIFLLVILLVMSGCIKKDEEGQKKLEPASLDKVIEDLISYKNNNQTRGLLATIYMEGVYVKDGVTYNYYSITKLEVMTFNERAKLFYDIDEAPANVYIILADKLQTFTSYISLEDLIANGTDASDGISACTEVYNVENGEIVCSDGSNLKSIAVTTAPTKLNYILGETTLDLTGLVVKGTYVDGTTKIESVTMDNISGFDTATTGYKTITVDISGRKSTFIIRVEEAVLESIEITTLPTKTTYIVGDVRDLTGLAVTGVFSDGSRKLLDIDAGTVSGYILTTTGTKTITVTIGGKSATYTITVLAKALTSISVTTQPTKTTYYVGDSTISLSGLVVTGTYNNGTTSAQTITTSNISGFSTTTSGSKTITVTVSGKTATFPITVSAAIVSANFTLTKTIDILKLKQYSATFEVADTSIKTLVLTGDGGVSPGEVTLTGTTATVSKLVTDMTITKITLKALDANGNQVGSTKTITLN